MTSLQPVQFGKMTLKRNEIKSELKTTADADVFYRDLEKFRKDHAELIGKLERAGLDLEVGSGVPPRLEDQRDEFESMRLSFINNRTGKRVDSLYNFTPIGGQRPWTATQWLEFLTPKALFFLNFEQTDEGVKVSPRAPLDKRDPSYADTDIVKFLNGLANLPQDEKNVNTAMDAFRPLLDKLQTAGLELTVGETTVYASDHAYRAYALNLSDADTGVSLKMQGDDTFSKKAQLWGVLDYGVKKVLNAMDFTADGHLKLDGVEAIPVNNIGKLETLIPDDGTPVYFDWVGGEPVVRKPAE